MSASMASVSMRQVASPRSIASALKSPKVSGPLGDVLRRAPKPQEEPWSPHSVASLKKSPSLSPYVTNVLSPYSHESVKKIRATPVFVKSSSRKLPWSDGGKHSSSLGVSTILARGDVLDSFEEGKKQPSVDTPERAQTLKVLRRQSSSPFTIGRGSYGTVIEALYKGKVVAVKVVYPNPESCRQINNELNCMKLSHLNIVSMLKVVLPRNDTAGVVIMERVPGYSLQKLLDHDFITDKIRQRIRYSMHICSALAHCHQNGLLHLDVKPQNVLVDMSTDTCKLCDFGCSSLIGADLGTLAATQGTVGYAAPEILQGIKPTPAADVYSLGITMWQLMSGEIPYKDMRGHAVIYKVVSAAFRPQLPSVCCKEDERFLSLVKKCWSQFPERRPSVADLLEELEIDYNRSCQN